MWSLPITVSPLLAKRLGLEVAIVLQELVYRFRNGEVREDGEEWFQETQGGVSDWFSFLSEYQVKKALKALEDEGVLVKETAGRHGTWFRLLPDRLEEINREAQEFAEPGQPGTVVSMAKWSPHE